MVQGFFIVYNSKEQFLADLVDLQNYGSSTKVGD